MSELIKYTIDEENFLNSFKGKSECGICLKRYEEWQKARECFYSHE